MSAFMVSPEESECAWIPEFEGVKVEEALGSTKISQIDICYFQSHYLALNTYFNTKGSSVHVVAKEEIVCLCKLATDLKGFHEIILDGTSMPTSHRSCSREAYKLTVDVSTHCSSSARVRAMTMDARTHQ